MFKIRLTPTCNMPLGGRSCKPIITVAPILNPPDYLPRDLHLKLPCRKLSPRYVGPFQIVKQITPVPFRLVLPANYRIPPTFHVSLLKTAGGPRAEEEEQTSDQGPPPILVDGEEAYQVQDLLDSRLPTRVRSCSQGGLCHKQDSHSASRSPTDHSSTFPLLHLGLESFLIIKASYLSPIWCVGGGSFSLVHHPFVLLVCRHLCSSIILFVKYILCFG